MYAHQVIDSFNDGTLCMPRNRGKLIELSINLLRKSIKYHIDDVENLMKLRVNDIKNHKKIFSENSIYYRIPYTTIWLDYSFKGLKTGILMISDERSDDIQLLFFDYVSEGHCWVCWPYNVVYRRSDSGFGVRVSEEDQADEDLENLVLAHASIADTFMLLLNCKNVAAEQIKAPEALNKKRRKNGKQEIFDYHVLNVVVPSTKQGYREQSEPLSHVRVHLCRGHFKEYTQEHPLFGKLTGLYWWQPHVRGQNKEGIVMKDYAIKTKEAV
ncbi:MAG: hypothetical protein A4E63_01763 [Syntrophorhabdus sp. PtaU1.Bin050]|nr:MAG: hypothetical protein A4E63_01763 [Syntrophorhabdus sp. PtaU1.Bin050]